MYNLLLYSQQLTYIATVKENLGETDPSRRKTRNLHSPHYSTSQSFANIAASHSVLPTARLELRWQLSRRHGGAALKDYIMKFSAHSAPLQL